eukprot:TRINITY_DN14044_c0_g1_i1.p1 TRINITY_DN14044_c0_g1~~TRINITY_DN14044_c0_g1_i1.p1  ORF type:complete len:231 (-),score=51.49 TRINITY_DN14044_c0_g1_i1:15-707(-)
MSCMDIDSRESSLRREYEHLEVSGDDVHKIVLSYLLHNCFKETAQAFISCTNMGQNAAECSVDIDKRKPIYNHIMKGEVMKAIELTNELASGLLGSNNDIYFELLALHFIELVRAKNCAAAVQFAQEQLHPFGKRDQYQDKYVGRLEDCMALLAYDEPETSPLFSLLAVEHRQTVADNLNRAVLAHANLPSYASMERLLQHATVVRQRLMQEHGKDGPPFFCLKNFLEGG